MKLNPARQRKFIVLGFFLEPPKTTKKITLTHTHTPHGKQENILLSALCLTFCVQTLLSQKHMDTPQCLSQVLSHRLHIAPAFTKIAAS